MIEFTGWWFANSFVCMVTGIAIGLLRRRKPELRDIQLDVLEFHHAHGIPIGHCIAHLDPDRAMLRSKLEREERVEILNAAMTEHPDDVAKECCDLIYVTLGRLVEMGISFPEVWGAVHRSNMAKVGGPVRADGKQLKPPGWLPPDVTGVIQPLR